MEFLVFLLFGGFVVLVVGAVMGMIAKGRTGQLQTRLDALEKEMRALRSHVRSEGQEPPSLPPTPVAVEPPPPPVAVDAVPWPVVAPAANAAAESPPAATVVPAAPEPSPAAPAGLEAEVVEFSAPEPTPQPEPEPTPEPAVTAAPSASGQFEGVEQALGLRWLTWVGVALLFLGVAFFLKYAYDRDWLGHLFGPRLRITTATAAALALAASGWRSLRNGMAALGHGLLGGGQALLYLTIFAAFQPAVMVVDTPLFDTTTAFVLMVLVTVAGLAVAVRLNALPMAFLAVLGGFATPVLVRSGRDARDLLCAYLLLLDLGVLLVALWRRWRALDLLAFAGTVVLFGGWFAAFHDAHPQPDATVAWLLVFHLVFVLLPFAHHWRHRTVVTVERFVLALANVAWTIGYATWMLREPAPGLLAAICLGGACLYVGLGIAVARRVGDDRRTRDGFFALATLLLTLGLFHLLPSNGTTTAWFAEASVLLWLGYRHAHHNTRRAALAVLAIAMVRTLVVHLPDAVPSAGLVWNPWFATLLVASLGVGAFGWIHRRFAAEATERRLAAGCGIAAGLWALLAGSLEILRHAEGHPLAWPREAPALAIAWLQVTGGLGFLFAAVRCRANASFQAAFLPLLAAAIAVGNAYDHYPAAAWPLLNGCCMAGLAVVGTLGIAGVCSRRLFAEAPLAAGLFGLLQLAAMVLATVETAAWLQRGGAQPGPQTMGQVLGWVWLGSALASGLAAATLASRRTFALAMVPLALAALTAFWSFGFALQPHRLVANQRFVFALLVATVVAAVRTLRHRIALSGTVDAFAAAGLLLVLLYGGGEAVTWSSDACRGSDVARWMVWLLGVAAVAGSAGGCWRARATGNRSLRGVALGVLTLAVLLPLLVYVVDWDAAWMFLNLRAALVAAAVATVMLWARDDRLRFLRWIGFGVGLIGLSAEPPAWFLAHIAERAEAERLALFSVTVTWVVTAGVLLAVGFRRKVRPVRLVALALFGLTAAKLLLLDMSGAQQLYRILAFVLVGLVFVGASWGYHRVERRLARPRG